ncbi:Serine protease inhibitor A3L [Bagarius yarrelli]|uniref:Thyroxine-binding globulin n=1 Tax=Bagarius yarrelli TaxID=175774 RepID=A0A556V5T5_BAGYA|nr:Serine protease inhibitor A3L [Bagarius yarrelli]
MALRVLGVFWCCCSLALTYTSAHGSLKQLSDSDDLEHYIKTVSEMNNDFAFRLYKAIVSGTQSKNVFFSPLSVSTALAALSLGAGGETHEQIVSGLGFNSSVITDEEMHQAFLNLLENLNQRTGVDLNVGTAVYVNDTFKPHPEFLENFKHLYLSEGFSVDFKSTTKTMNEINKYVEEKTHGKISKFTENLDPQTIMYLLSYVYFKGKWSIPFNPNNTKEAKFHVDEETTVPVQMMYRSDYFHFHYDMKLATIIVRLDYNDSFSMMLVLPNDLTVLQDALRPHHITNWNKHIRKRNIELFLPKLSLKTSYSLINILAGIGMKDMFTEKANFTGITDDEICVSQAVHKSTLDVDEAGTTATAVTQIHLSARTGPQSVRFNEPFMIFIIDQKTKNIMFMGKIGNPLNSEINE